MTAVTLLEVLSILENRRIDFDIRFIKKIRYTIENKHVLKSKEDKCNNK